MLREIKSDGTRRNMACYHDPLMVRFIQSLARLDRRDLAVTSIDDADAVTVRFSPTDGSAEKAITIPLAPEIAKLKQTAISMHGCPTIGYEMGPSYNQWFSNCFGKDVELIFVGHNRWKVLGNLSPNAAPTSGVLPSILSTISSVAGLAKPAIEDGHE